MNREAIERLREEVGCAAVLEQAGFAIDRTESTRRAVKFRRGGEIVIVTHEGRGWFDPLGEDKGDVFSLACHLERLTFPEAFDRIAGLVGFRPASAVWTARSRETSSDANLIERWDKRRRPWPGSATWRYLSRDRVLPAPIIHAAISRGRLREGPHGSMWAAHTNDAGIVIGWEERGPEWRGFSTGGTKILFRLGQSDGLRLCVTEAAIDAMSLAAFEGLRDGTLYLSTGGGWSPATDAALRSLARRPDVDLVAATDNNTQGETFADRLRALTEETGCGWQRLRPPTDDWNEALQERGKERRERREAGGGVPHSRRPRQGGSFARLAPALDPAGRDAGGS